MDFDGDSSSPGFLQRIKSYWSFNWVAFTVVGLLCLIKPEGIKTPAATYSFMVGIISTNLIGKKTPSVCFLSGEFN